MNVGQLRTLLNGLDDDVEVITSVYMAKWIGGSNGLDMDPSISVCDSGEMELCFDNEPDSSLWTMDEEEGLHTNVNRYLVIGGSVEEIYSD